MPKWPPATTRPRRRPTPRSSPAPRAAAWMTDASAAVALLRRPATIRERCGMVFEAGRGGTLPHFALDLEQLPRAVDYVRDMTLAAYPTLAIPFHSRWRHFAAGGIDRWEQLDRALGPI